MVSKCANPACSASFRYLHAGRLFELETDVRHPDALDSPLQTIEYFWLCEDCARTLEVVIYQGRAMVRPRTSDAPPEDFRKKRARGAG
jgi:hypothetical protein